MLDAHRAQLKLHEAGDAPSLSTEAALFPFRFPGGRKYLHLPRHTFTTSATGNAPLVVLTAHPTLCLCHQLCKMSKISAATMQR